MSAAVMPGDADACERIAFTHARTFALASRLLVHEKRRAAFAVYAFCRTADDLVDAAGVALAPDQARARLARYREQAHAALTSPSSDPVLRELAHAVSRFDIPTSALDELVAGVERDLQGTAYETWDELAAYCAGVASSVGEMCAAIFGVADPATARPAVTGHARQLGLAMQLTNILRDVGEDALRGRCYLPAADLALFDLTPDVVLRRDVGGAWPRWRAFMAFEIARARALYLEAIPGIALLAPDAQRCALACATGYAEILSVIESMDYDSLSRRAVVPASSFVRVLARAWFRRPPDMPDAAAVLLLAQEASATARSAS